MKRTVRICYTNHAGRQFEHPFTGTAASQYEPPDRAYQLKARANGNAGKYQAAITVLKNDAQSAFVNADKLMATYQRLCKAQNIIATIEAPVCDCPYCKGEIRGSMNHEDWERFTFEVGAAVVVG